MNKAADNAGKGESMATTKRYPVYIVVDKLAFCSPECIHNALEYEQSPRQIRVSEALAKIITCYGCGLSLDEATSD